MLDRCIHEAGISERMRLRFVFLRELQKSRAETLQLLLSHVVYARVIRIGAKEAEKVVIRLKQSGAGEFGATKLTEKYKLLPGRGTLKGEAKFLQTGQR